MGNIAVYVRFSVCLLIGSLVGWCICAFHCFHSRPQYTESLTYLFVICVGSCAGSFLAVRITKSNALYTQESFTFLLIIIGTLTGWFCRPSTSTALQHQVFNPFVDPTSVFRLTDAAIGGFIAGIMSPFLSTLRARLNKLNERTKFHHRDPSTSEES